MATSRRNFLKTGTMCALFAGVPNIVADVVTGRPTRARGLPQDNSITLTRGTFTPYLNTTFRIQTGPSTVVDVTLVNITDLKAAAPDPVLIAGVESFSLLFAGSTQSPGLADNTYTIQHDALGTFSLFLVAVEKPEIRHYEAIITRL